PDRLMVPLPVPLSRVSESSKPIFALQTRAALPGSKIVFGPLLPAWTVSPFIYVVEVVLASVAEADPVVSPNDTMDALVPTGLAVGLLLVPAPVSVTWPDLMLSPPVNVFAPLRVAVPVPSFVTLPEVV